MAFAPYLDPDICCVDDINQQTQTSLLGRVRQAVEWLRNARERQRTRHELTRMSDLMLKDIGLTRQEARAEARRPFWE